MTTLLYRSGVLPFLLGLGVGVVFNDQIRQGWQMLRGAVPQVPDIPSFGGGAPVDTAPEPVDNTGAGAGNMAYAYKADFDREYERHSETYNNGIPFF